MAFWRSIRDGGTPGDGRPDTGANKRVYAIGDVHGRVDLLDDLLSRVARDDSTRTPVSITLILLGDLIDRGLSSRQVVERAISLTGSGGDIRCLKGNHEEAFVLAARGDSRVVPLFRRMEGVATLASYGLDPARFATMADAEVVDWIAANVPANHIDFLDGLPDQTVVGDYLFVHAGIRPGVPLDEQSPADMRWIRAPFLKYRRAHPKMVIHGHSVTEDVDEQDNRIGIDTGAYASGRLTAIGLEGTRRWIIQTDD